MKPVIVAIVGGSASGKTTLAHTLGRELAPEALVVSLDRFYRDLSHLPEARWHRVNFDRPERIDWTLFQSALDALVAGRSATLPIYDYERHARMPDVERVAPRRFLVLEGLWLLRRLAVRRHCHVSVFVDCPARERLRRRQTRDVEERGRDPEEVLFRWHRQAEPGFRKLVAPQRARADFVVRSPVRHAALRRIVDQLHSEFARTSAVP